MPTLQDIEQQQQRLVTHRKTLAYALEQQAKFDAGHVPGHLIHSIAETRDQIARIKAILRDWGERVEDLPDEIAVLSTYNIAPISFARATSQTTAIRAYTLTKPHRRELGPWLKRNAIALIIMAILFIGGVVSNLFSEEIKEPLQVWLGEHYSLYLYGAMAIVGVLTAGSYVYEHHYDTIEQDDNHGLFHDPDTYFRNRQVFINDMRRRFKERLDSAPKIIKLRFAERQGAVDKPGELIRPYDLARRQPGQPDVVLPAKTRLLDLYDQHNGQLLILGAPGAGKTFLLYELAYELVERAAADDSAPVPVIFSLATWQPKLSLQEWMIADLSRRYGTKSQFIASFFASGMLLPLLDGLDEVDTLERREQCVTAINAYRTEYQQLAPPLIVTCREREYQDLPALKLNTALIVQPLAPAQVNGYLAGATFAPLRQALTHDAELAKLARTPLLLGLMAEAYRERAPQLPPDADAETVRQIVLSDYVAHCCAPRADVNALKVPVNKLRAFLAWLARGMIAHNNQQDFYIEFLQPSWLSSRTWRWCWHGFSGIFGGLIIGLVFGLVFGLTIGLLIWLLIGLLSELFTGLVFGLLFGLVFGLLFGLVFGLAGRINKIKPTEQVHWSWQNWRTSIQKNTITGLIFGLVVGFVNRLVEGLIEGLIGGLAFGLAFGLFGGLVGGLIDGVWNGLVGSLVNERSVPNQAIHRSFRTALVIGLIGVLIFGLISGLIIWLIAGLIIGLIAGVIVGLIAGLVFGLFQYGGIAIIQHYILRIMLALSTPAPYLLVPWLEEARMRGLLVRVGGGYRFYHELLQRHFAAHQEPGFPQVPILAEQELDQAS